jgi:hypothetical protein
MLGNDVIDFGDPDTRPGALHPRWDERVFAARERAALAASALPERLRWALWGAKEAAYKLARKLDPKTVFAPSRFEVALDAQLRGHVAWPGGAARVAVLEAKACLHALAWDGATDEARILHGFARTTGPDPAAASAAARELAERETERRLGLGAGTLRVHKRGRVPRLLHTDGGAFDLSLSHHGAVVAFACDPVVRPA